MHDHDWHDWHEARRDHEVTLVRRHDVHDDGSDHGDTLTSTVYRPVQTSTVSTPTCSLGPRGMVVLWLQAFPR